MEGNNLAIMGANVYEHFDGTVGVAGFDVDQAYNALIRGKGFDDDWHKVYFEN